MKIYYIKNTSDCMIFLVGGHFIPIGILTSIVHISYPHRKKIHWKIRTNFISSTGPQKNISDIQKKIFLEITELGLTQLKILKYKVWYLGEPILYFPFN